MVLLTHAKRYVREHPKEFPDQDKTMQQLKDATEEKCVVMGRLTSILGEECADELGQLVNRHPDYIALTGAFMATQRL